MENEERQPSDSQRLKELFKSAGLKLLRRNAEEHYPRISRTVTGDDGLEKLGAPSPA